MGSPGIDRPLRTLADFNRFVGERIEVKLREAIDNRKIFSGILLKNAETEAEQFSIEFDVKKNEKQVIAFAYEDVEKAKLDPVLDFKGKKK